MSDAPQRPWLGWIGWAGGAFLGLVLLVAAWAKALDPLAFAEQITKEGLDFLLPALAVALIAIALEVGLGAALLLNLRRRGVLVGAIALVLFFLFLTGRNYWRYANGLIDDEPGCGCFGNLVERSPAEAFWQDLLLMVPALGLAWLGRPTGKLGWWRPALVGVLTVGAAIFAWQSPTLPLDNLATRLKPAVQISDLCAGKEEDDTRVCLDSLVPELQSGTHWIVMSELDDPAFLATVDVLNERLWNRTEPAVWVLTDATEEDLFAFQWATPTPAFVDARVREVPTAMLTPLYRTLPRSFQIEDGVVTQTWRGLPPEVVAATPTGPPETSTATVAE